MHKDTVRVVVVGHTVKARKVLCEVLSKIPQVEVVGAFATGRSAEAKMESVCPDLMVLDFDLPEGECFSALKELQIRDSKTAVIIVSTMSRQGAKETMKALDLGAFAFISKPKDINQVESEKSLLSQLKPIISSFVVKRLLGSRKKTAKHKKSLSEDATSQVIIEMQARLSRDNIAPPPAGLVQIVAIGISTGGPKALAKVIPLLPEDFRVPVVIVQHMPPVFSQALAESLNQKSKISVVEGEEGMSLLPGRVYIAPGGQQMKVVRKSSKICLKVTDDPSENHCKPAADYLFRSIADLYGARALGVIMTGMGSDGTLGLKRMKEKGCACVIAQDEKSCVVFGMPFEAMKAGLVDVVCPLSGMAEEIVTRVN